MNQRGNWGPWVKEASILSSSPAAQVVVTEQPFTQKYIYTSVVTFPFKVPVGAGEEGGGSANGM